MRSVTVSAMHSLLGVNCEMPKEYARILRRADDLTKILVACTHSALNSVAYNENSGSGNIGFFLGTAFGPLETNFRFLDTLLDDGEGQASPTLFSHSVHNAASGYLSRIFSTTGPSFTITSYTWPFLLALRQAALSIASGVIERAIVTTAELYSPVLGYAGKQLLSDECAEYSSGAVCWILDKTNSFQSNCQIRVLDVEVHEELAEVASFLTRVGEEYPGCDDAVFGKGVLSSIFSLTEYAHTQIKNGESEFKWEVSAPFGKASVLFSLD